ncbi:Crp-like helix-turn-helix protein [Gelidibacter sediminis]|uniref:Crp-like helix-turn-helix protein n=1 Tax=Gelidibacter sediminis TaxID=1608710 RepID=A0A4R7PYI5_9FLAO|nr:response regulator [Gelidibacter sediminis]TDU39472.1 Crp-like helix-turn-helix protein [Gelidibacter sediminis]
MKRLLLIEDDTVLRENTAELLELSDFEVITAPNGKIGMQFAKEHLPDLIVCDIMMPEMDGYEVLEALAKENSTKHIPFIYLSAKTERNDVRKGMNLGADDYITKPFSEEELISAIESRLAKVSILKEIHEKGETVPENRSELRTLNDLKNFFDDNGDTIHVAEGDHIYEEGQHANTIYLIIKGLVKCHILDEQGKELTTALHKEDDLFGYTSFSENTSYQETATAIQKTELVGVSKNTLKGILNTNHQVTMELIDLLTEDIKGTKDQLLQMAYSSVHKKTATTILKFAEKLNKKSDEAIRISRNDLASVAGIATETLIRTMSSFKKEGILEIEGRNIKIIDIEKLKSIS